MDKVIKVNCLPPLAFNKGIRKKYDESDLHTHTCSHTHGKGAAFDFDLSCWGLDLPGRHQNCSGRVFQGEET